MKETPAPATDDRKGESENPEAAPECGEDEGSQRGGQDTRSAMILTEAEVIAENLKKSGTRR